MSQPLDTAPTTAREPLPWWILLRAPQFAMHALPLLLAATATLLTMLVDEVAERTLPRPDAVVTMQARLETPALDPLVVPPAVIVAEPGRLLSDGPPQIDQKIEVTMEGVPLGTTPPAVGGLPTASRFGETFATTWMQKTLDEIVTLATAIAWPITHTLKYGQQALNGPGTLLQRLLALLFTSVLASLWLITGTAIARAVACQWTSDSTATVPRTVQFALRRCGSSLGGPLLPLAGILVVLALTMALVLPGQLPWGLGTAYVTLVTPLTALATLAAGALVAVLITAAVLMPSAVAVDANDGFASFSRVFNYVTTRPWLAAALAAGAIVLGTLAWSAIGAVIWAGSSTLSHGLIGASGSRRTVNDTAWLLGWLWSAYGASVFWTSATFIYLLLREAVDLVPVGVHAPWDEDFNGGDEFQVVGMQAPVGPRTTEASAVPASAAPPQADATGSQAAQGASLEDVATPTAPPTA